MSGASIKTRMGAFFIAWTFIAIRCSGEDRKVDSGAILPSCGGEERVCCLSVDIEEVHMPHGRAWMMVVGESLGSEGRGVSQRFGVRNDAKALCAVDREIHVVGEALVPPRYERVPSCKSVAKFLALEKIGESPQNLFELHPPRIPRGTLL